MKDIQIAPSVKPEDALASDISDTINTFGQQSFDPKMAATRAKNPFVEMVKFPNKVLQYALTQNVAQDINIPRGTKYIKIVPVNGNVFVTRNGNAQVPSTSLPEDMGSLVILPNSPHDFFYVDDVSSLSVITSTAGVFVTVPCWTEE